MNERLPKFKGQELLAEIEKSTEGLTYTSETDTDVEPVFVDSSEAKNFLKSVGKDEKSETLEPSAFFDRLAHKKQWFGQNEITHARKFALLERI